jgi:hypothetical protein
MLLTRRALTTIEYFKTKGIADLEEVEVEWHGPYSVDTALKYFHEYEDYGLYMITRKWGKYPEKVLYVGLTYLQDFSTRLSQHKWWLSITRGTIKIRVGYLIENRASEKRLKDVENLLICWYGPEYNEKGLIYHGRDLRIANSGRRGPLDKIIDSDELES